MKSNSGLVSPQNPLITILKQKRETRTTPTYIDDDERPKAYDYPNKLDTHGNGIYVKFKRGQESRSQFHPMSIQHYEPGHSSIVIAEEIREPKEFNPPILKPGELCKYSDNSEALKIKIKKKSESDSPKPSYHFTNGGTTVHTTEMNGDMNIYKDIMKGGDIPTEGLKNYMETRKVKTLPSNSSKDLEDPFSSIEETLNQAVSDLHLKSSTAYDSSSYCQPSRARVEKEMEILARRKDVERLLELEKKRMREKEIKRNVERRHNDFFLQKDKSPVRLNRYDTKEETCSISTTKSSINYGVAMYNFTAKSDRELTVRKGEKILILRRVDKNWWEAEKDGNVGIVPVTYIRQVKELEALQRLAPSRGHYPQARILFDFETNYPSELPVKKGERVSLLRKIDNDWLEVRSRNGQGAVPSSHLQPITNDYDDETSFVPSRTVTPSFYDLHERLNTASPAGSVFSVLSQAPTIPSAPRSPIGSQRSVSVLSDWPDLDASLANLQEEINISNKYSKQHMSNGYSSQKDYQQKQLAEHQHEPKLISHQRKQELIDRYNSILRKQHQHQQQSINKLTSASFPVQEIPHYDENRGIKTNNYTLDINNTMTRSNTSDFSNHHQTIFASPERFLNQNNTLNESQGYFDTKRLEGSYCPSNQSTSTLNSTFHPDITNHYNITHKENLHTSQLPQYRYMSHATDINEINNINRNNNYNSTSNIAEKEVVSLKPIKLQPVLPPDYSNIKMERSALRSSMVQNTPSRNQMYRSFNFNNNYNNSLTNNCNNTNHSNNNFHNNHINFKNTNFPNNSHNFKHNTINQLPKQNIMRNNAEIRNHHNSTLNPGYRSTIIVGSKEMADQRKSREPNKRNHSLINMISTKYKNNYRVLNEYIPRKADELCLRKGDAIKVVEKCKDGWWVGASMETGDMGLFPGNHVAMI